MRDDKVCREENMIHTERVGIVVITTISIIGSSRYSIAIRE